LLTISIHFDYSSGLLSFDFDYIRVFEFLLEHASDEERLRADRSVSVETGEHLAGMLGPGAVGQAKEMRHEILFFGIQRGRTMTRGGANRREHRGVAPAMR
jgi:hypothetical protein